MPAVRHGHQLTTLSKIKYRTVLYWYDQVYGAQKQIKGGKHKSTNDGKDKSRTKQEKATDRKSGKKDVKKLDPKYNKKTVPKKVQQNDKKIANKMFINDLIDYPGGPGKLIGIGLGIRKLGSKLFKPIVSAIAPAKRTKDVIQRASPVTRVVGRPMSLVEKAARDLNYKTLNLPDKGNPKANWYQNASQIRLSHRNGERFFSVGGADKGFWRAEQNLFKNLGLNEPRNGVGFWE